MAIVDSKKAFYFGNAKADDVRGSGWFVGQFVPAELGLRHETAVELKWGIHPDGEKRPQPWANQNGTTISVLIEGSLRLRFYIDGTQQEVMLRTKGDYVAFGPKGRPLVGSCRRHNRSVGAVPVCRGRIASRPSVTQPERQISLPLVGPPTIQLDRPIAMGRSFDDKVSLATASSTTAPTKKPAMVSDTK